MQIPNTFQLKSWNQCLSFPSFFWKYTCKTCTFIHTYALHAFQRYWAATYLNKRNTGTAWFEMSIHLCAEATNKLVWNYKHQDICSFHGVFDIRNSYLSRKEKFKFKTATGNFSKKSSNNVTRKHSSRMRTDRGSDLHSEVGYIPYPQIPLPPPEGTW